MKAKTQAPSITTGPITGQLLLFFFPILLGTFFQQLYNTVDTVIVGSFVGTNTALAAVGGATGQLVNLFVGFFIGLSSGCGVIISQYYGARGLKECPHGSGLFAGLRRRNHGARARADQILAPRNVSAG